MVRYIWNVYGLRETSIFNYLLKHNKNDRPLVGENDHRRWKRNELKLTIPNTGQHRRKVVLYIWLDWKVILYYKLLPELGASSWLRSELIESIGFGRFQQKVSVSCEPGSR